MDDYKKILRSNEDNQDKSPFEPMKALISPVHPQAGLFFHDFLSSADLFQNLLFLKISSGKPSDC